MRSRRSARASLWYGVGNRIFEAFEPGADNFVHDLNIKLPKDVAKNAATAQWYETMTLNKKPLKNEGRFTISAPIAANNYECQVTPVRMEKDKNNFLDIRFKHKSFKVFTLSVMAQKPIIKKH